VCVSVCVRARAQRPPSPHHMSKLCLVPLPHLAHFSQNNVEIYKKIYGK
jgi:hypothetical protein